MAGCCSIDGGLPLIQQLDGCNSHGRIATPYEGDAEDALPVQADGNYRRTHAQRKDSTCKTKTAGDEVAWATVPIQQDGAAKRNNG